MSNLRNPSWPCELASFVIGCTNARLEDVSASRWSRPAAMETILLRATIEVLEYEARE